MICLHQTTLRANQLPLNTDQNYAYTLLTDIVYHAPNRLQDKTLKVAEEVWQDRVLTPDFNQPELTETVEAHLLELKSIFPTQVIVIEQDGSIRAKSNEAIRHVTRGLDFFTFFEILNESDAGTTVQVSRKNGVLPGSRAIHCPAQQRTIIFLRSRIDDTENISTFQLSPLENPESGRELSIALKVDEPARVSGTTRVTETDEIFPARVYALGSDRIYRFGREFRDNQTLSEKPIVFRPSSYRLPFFYTSGEFEVVLPPGETQFSIERGFESPIERTTLTLEEGSQHLITLSTDRHIDLRSKGWISGDTHIHWALNQWDTNEDLELLAMVQRAEDLRIANNLTLYQFRPGNASFTKPDQAPMGPILEFSDEDYHIQMGEEFRNDNFFGHINLLNISELIEPLATGMGSGGPIWTPDWPMNTEIIKKARNQGGISVEAHNLGPFNASAVPVNLVLGYSDSIDQLEPEHYYDFLNSGIQIGLSNGSDHPARIAGSSRVYVRSGKRVNYTEWCAALAKGKSFTSSGPILLLSVDGAEPGDTLYREAGGTVSFSLSAWSRHPLGSIAIISNDEVLAEATTQKNEFTLTDEIKIGESRWFTARCSQNDYYNAANQSNVAHTSAVYVYVNNKPVLKSSSIKKWIENIGVFRARLENEAVFEEQAQRQEALDFIDEALIEYAERLELAKEEGN